MALNIDQEREHIARLERMGVSSVRSELEGGKISPHFVQLTSTWLSAKDKEAEERREASDSAQMELARRVSEVAERAATAARRANRRATIALVIATVSIVAAAIGTAASINPAIVSKINDVVTRIWLSHINAHKMRMRRRPCVSSVLVYCSDYRCSAWY
jgi:hypothetical protein